MLLIIILYRRNEEYESEEEEETAQEKRVRLAKKYLQHIEEEGSKLLREFVFLRVLCL